MLEKILIPLPSEDISKLLNDSTSIEEFIINLHKAVVGEEKFDSMEKLNGYVRCSKVTWEFICEKIIEKFKVSNAGLVWMNYGFGVDYGMTEDFIIDIYEAITPLKNILYVSQEDKDV